jgi:hypothetical protein
MSAASKQLIFVRPTFHMILPLSLLQIVCSCLQVRASAKASLKLAQLWRMLRRTSGGCAMKSVIVIIVVMQQKLPVHAS